MTDLLGKVTDVSIQDEEGSENKKLRLDGGIRVEVHSDRDEMVFN